MRQFIKYIVIIVCACSCWSCVDDEIGQEPDGGLTTVNLSIDFSDLQVVSPGARSAGDAIGKMTDVCVLFYKGDGTLAMDGANPIYYYTTVSNTESVNMKKKVPAGAYKVVAVANMGNLVANRYNEVSTWGGLKSISLEWNSGTIAANRQMFGFFTISSGSNSIDDAIAKDGMSKVAPTSHEAPELVLSGNMALYAKLYRTVAKVSVAFDGEGLYSNVFVTIKSIRLGNLPRTCALWTENKGVTDIFDGVDQSENLTETEFGLLRVTNRGTGESLFPKDAHSPTGPSLFMFENRQGTEATSGDKDKLLTNKPYGAYIEIEAQYANESTGSHGKIIYRYMLGEDVPGKYDNYNLTRNRHYKVTLMLQKSGKEDPYWRVEYTEDPTITIPTEVNISYRHATKLDIPFTVKEINDGIEKVEAEIVDNPWFDDLVDGRRDAMVSSGTLQGPLYGFLAWAGDLSGNGSYGVKKTKPVVISEVDGKYKLSVQTESLGFMTSYGDKRADSFTGYNNYSNPRTAKIKVTITYNSGATKTVEVKVVQVPRVVNPIAVYRKWNNDTPFKVRLLNALGAEIESYGPWSAEVESGTDWIGIKREGTATYVTSFTSGEEGGAIRFDYKPLSKLGNEGGARCGVIVVRFSNYNVEHRIYVRQGYAPMAIGTSNNLWTSFNYIGVDESDKPLFTSSPMEEGAWLRSGNSVGILADNINNTDRYGVRPGLFKMSDGSDLPWSEIENMSGIKQFTAPGYELPTEADVNNLQNFKDYSGFGVGYDDNATETMVFDEEVQYANPAMGRRGFVICDKEGRNLFFPAGKRGYGRRRQDVRDGAIHYAHDIQESSATNRPALYGLYKAMGAIYWTNHDQQLSFNYSLSNIEVASRNDNSVGFDACFARLMKAADVVKFERRLYFSAEGSAYYNKTASITPWGKITECAITPSQISFIVSFKYNIEDDKAESGLIIKIVQNGKTYEKKLSIRELEAVQDGGTITFD